MSSSPVVSLRNVGKYYEIYEKPRHRLWQMICAGRRKFYSEYWACAQIDLDVYPGQCLGIVGRNGAGKSTLLQLIAGTLAPSCGEVITRGRLAALLELGSGFNPDFTGRENVWLNAAILGLDQKEIAAKFPAIAAFADIGDFMERPVKTYSSGMALRLAFAVMANVDADILIIDEALAVGDAFFTQKCMRFLRDFMARHTVIFVSHDTSAVCSLCSDAILMEAGKIVMRGGPREVSQRYLEDIYAERQGEISGVREEAQPRRAEPVESARDMRAELFNSCALRNDIEVFRFTPRNASFGAGGGIIENVWLADGEGRPWSWIVGGEKVWLHILCAIKQPMTSPIVGFLVNNGFGQNLFGDNTWLAYRESPLELAAGEKLHAAFGFQMPILAPGEYFITAALGEGTPERHVQHHWLHDAASFVSHTSSVASGIMGVPMFAIELQISP